MKQKKKSDVAALLDYAGSHRGLTFLGLALSAAAMLLSMAPYICIWLAARDLIEVAPDWTAAQSVTRYGWMAFATEVGGIALYFAGLMCTHLAAFRTAANIRKRGVAHVMEAPLGWFAANASGLIRGRLDAAAADTETLLAHNLADVVGTITLFVAMLALMFVFDWRMGCACLLAAVVSILSMFAMMGGKNAQLMAEYQAAQDRMTKAGTEYVRGIPVVKIFQQTVYSFKAFQQAIEEYSAKAEHYQADVCRTPQSINLSVTEGAFVFLVPAALFLAPGALATGSFAGFVTDFAFYAVFSAIISTALARIMFASSGIMLAGTALGRIRMVMDAPELKMPEHPKAPQNSRVEFRAVSFTYDGAETPALSHVSFTAEPYQVLSQHPKLNGVKEASGNFSLLAHTRHLCGDDFYIWSGNDDQVVPMMSLGAKGVISVASNIIPEVMVKMTHLCLDNDFASASKLQIEYMDLIDALFCDVNPIPVKEALNLLGMEAGPVRLPLCEMEEKNKARLRAAMQAKGLL